MLAVPLWHTDRCSSIAHINGYTQMYPISCDEEPVHNPTHCASLGGRPSDEMESPAVRMHQSPMGSAQSFKHWPLSSLPEAPLCEKESQVMKVKGTDVALDAV